MLAIYGPNLSKLVLILFSICGPILATYKSLRLSDLGFSGIYSRLGFSAVRGNPGMVTV